MRLSRARAPDRNASAVSATARHARAPTTAETISGRLRMLRPMACTSSLWMLSIFSMSSSFEIGLPNTRSQASCPARLAAFEAHEKPRLDLRLGAAEAPAPSAPARRDRRKCQAQARSARAVAAGLSPREDRSRRCRHSPNRRRGCRSTGRAFPHFLKTTSTPCRRPQCLQKCAWRRNRRGRLDSPRRRRAHGTARSACRRRRARPRTSPFSSGARPRKEAP